MRKKVKELQRLAKANSKENPAKALEFIEQALTIEPYNPYTISRYGWILKQIGKPKEFIDYYEKLETGLTDIYIDKAYYWCLHDVYIKENPQNDMDFDNFISTSEKITEFCAQNSNDSSCINLNTRVVLRVVSILNYAENDSLDKQLEWMQKIDVNSFDLISDTFINGEGVEITSTVKERYYNQMCWLLYKKTISDYNEELSSDGFDEFIENAEYIVQNCNQKDENNWLVNPYVLTVLKVVKIYNKKNFKNYSKILEWISKLDSNVLSEEVYSFKDSEGKDREMASPKEFYYQHISKAYEKLRKYEECVNACDLGLEEIKRWHYRNHIWIRARRYYSNCIITDDFDDAIKKYINLAEKEKHWFMFHKIALLYMSKGNINDSLLFALKAFNSNIKFDIEKMINLIYDIGILLQAKSKSTQANIFFQACGYYRNLRGWNLSEELRFIIKENNIDVTKKFDLKELRMIIKEHLPSLPISQADDENIFTGKIRKILLNGDGFIERENNESLYFRVRENKGFNVGDVVNFEIGTNKDFKPIAVNVIKKERR